MCILSYIYGSHSLEFGEDIELFYVVQDFCLVTVSSHLKRNAIYHLRRRRGAPMRMRCVFRKPMDVLMVGCKLCVLSTLSSEMADWTLVTVRYYDHAQIFVCKNPTLVGHQSALMGNTTAASCTCRVLVRWCTRGRAASLHLRLIPPYDAYLLGSSTCSAPADRCCADSLGYIQK